MPDEQTGCWSICCCLCRILFFESRGRAQFPTKESADEFAQSNGWGIPSTHSGHHLCPQCLSNRKEDVENLLKISPCACSPSGSDEINPKELNRGS